MNVAREIKMYSVSLGVKLDKLKIHYFVKQKSKISR